MIQAAKLASAKRITAVIPWYPYSRQDKKSAPREPITGKLVADFLRTAGVDRVLTMDLHAGQVQGFFDIPVDHMTALPLFAQHFRDQGLSGEGVVSVAPDAGRAKMGVKFAQMVEGDFAIMHKTRPAHDVAAISEVTGHVRGKALPGRRRRDHDRRHDHLRRARAQGGRCDARFTSSRPTRSSPRARSIGSRRRRRSTG